MRKYKFTVHYEFTLDEDEVWPDDWWVRTEDKKLPNCALKELVAYSTAGLCDTLPEWGVPIPDEAVTVQELTDPSEIPETGAWNYHD